MSRTQALRRNKDGRMEDRFAERRRRFRPVLRVLGLEEEFRRMPRLLQEFYWQRKYPDPVLTVDDAVPAAARRSLVAAFGGAELTVEAADGSTATMEVRDFLTIVGSMRFLMEATRSVMGGVDDGFRERGLDVLNRFWARYEAEAFRVWSMRLFTASAEYGRMDERHVALRMEHGFEADHKVHVRVSAYVERPERVQVRFAEGTRPAYRVAHNAGPYGLTWVTWNGRELGVCDTEEVPVYVQSHALKQLHERLDVPGVGPMMEYNMAYSLAHPKVAGRVRGGDFLFECVVNGMKVGYLVVALAEGRAVVRTFLLVTMSGTPEGDRLYSEFRLTRDEASWLGLHRLSSFTGTDLREDAELREMLARCGCGQLFELPRTRFGADSPSFAGELRKFLRLGAARPAAETAGEAMRKAA